MNKSVMLKWSRRDKKLSQKKLAEEIGISENIISRLELSSSEWNKLDESTKSKLNEFFEGCKYWESLVGEPDIEDTSNFVEIDAVEESKETKSSLDYKIQYSEDMITKYDVKVLTLIEFAYEGLNESKTHEDFKANVDLIKRILKKYNL